MQPGKFAATLLFGLGLAVFGWSQTNNQTATTEAQTTHGNKSKKTNGKKEPSPGRQVANGTGNIAAGAGKGAGAAAAGVGKGAADLVTLHPIDAAGSVGKGAGKAGKDVGVGATKGTGKVVKGIGRGIKHIF
jgi:hypothetical protein